MYNSLFTFENCYQLKVVYKQNLTSGFLRSYEHAKKILFGQILPVTHTAIRSKIATETQRFA